MIARHFTRFLLNYQFVVGMSTKPTRQSTLTGFVKVGDTKKRKMDKETEETEGQEACAEALPDTSNSFKFEEIKGDLFSSPATSCLAHCISADVRMGKGIAVIFKKKFGGVQELISQCQKPGGCAVLRREERYVYYLVTKGKYWEKPTYKTLTASLEAMKTHCIKSDVNHVSMPLIGCGLDGLQWPKVTEILKDTFGDSNIKISVYRL